MLALGKVAGVLAAAALVGAGGVAVRDAATSGAQIDSGVVFYSGLGENGVAQADRYASWEFVESTSSARYSTYRSTSRCGTDRADDFPRGLNTLVGWSLGRLGPIYFLDAARDRWPEINTIVLLDPGVLGEMQGGCENQIRDRPSRLLHDWLQGGVNRRLVIYSGGVTQRDGHAGLNEFYLKDTDGTSEAAKVFLCDVDPSIAHDPGFVARFMPFAVAAPGCPPGVARTPLSTAPTTLSVEPLPPQPPISVDPLPAQPQLSVNPATAAPPVTVTPPQQSTPKIPTQPTIPVSPPATSPPATGPPQTQPPNSVGETTGGVVHTWTNYSNAGGSPGQVIPAYTAVQIRCRLHGFAVANGNTWWYRIAQAPWSDSFYASADAFYNNGQTSGTLVGTPWVDERLPLC